MGYTTDFDGAVTVTPPLNEAERQYLRNFSRTRRVDRDQGLYFADGGTSGRDSTVRDYNRPPEGQPSLWCDWVPTEDGTGIEWSGAEKFRDADAWMQYLIDHFLRPGAHANGQEGFEAFTFDHVVSGVIHAQGEDPDDSWDLVVEDNVVSVEHEHAEY